ncbi:hypothetical protein YC2023_044490 [Brassica napus]
MIHSSIILAIPCTIHLTPKQGLINPTPTYRSIQNHERRSGTSKQERDEIWSPPPRHRRGGGREKRDHGEGEKKKRETAQEGERSTARVFGLREFSAELRFRFVMRQKKVAAAPFIGWKEETLGFLSNGP